MKPNTYQIEYEADDKSGSEDVIANSEEEAVEKFIDENDDAEITCVTYQGPGPATED